MTIEELLAALQAIIDEAGQEPLTNDQVERYEALEVQLAAARKDAEIRSRQTAYTTPVTNPLVPASTSTKKDDTLERAFDHYLRTGRENADILELRAQSEGVPTEGGYLVPEGFRNKLIERMKAFGGLASVVEEFSTDSGNPLPWPTVDDTANVGEIVEEGGAFTSGADLVFGSASLGAYSYMAGGAGSTPLRVSYELAQDSAFDIQGMVSKALGTRISRIQAVHLISGSGVSQPLGIVTGLTPVEADATALTYAGLLEYVHSVDPAYRENGCRWAFNDNSLQMIRGLVDDNGRPILKGADDGIAGEPGGQTLLGYPVTIDQGFGDFVGTSGADDPWGVFGQLSEGYVIRRVRAVEILVNPYSRMNNRQIEYSAWARMDATQQNTFAYSVLGGFTA